MLAAIDPWRLAKNAQAVTGEFSFAELPRFCASLYHTAETGKASFSWQFGQDEAGRAFIRGEAKADITLRCQRCLRAMSLQLVAHTLVGLLTPEQAENDLPGGWEALVIEDVPVALSELLEDELILALPIAPRHERCPPHEYTTDGLESDLAGSFAVLAALKNSRNA